MNAANRTDPTIDLIAVHFMSLAKSSICSARYSANSSTQQRIPRTSLHPCQSPTAQPAWEVANSNQITADSSNTVCGENGTPLSEATGKVGVKLDDFGNQPYVIAVHASAKDYAKIVACGAIAGPKQDAKLIVTLTAVGDAKIAGIAILDEDTSGVLGIGKDQVQVTVYLVNQDAAASGTPAA